MKLCHLLVSVLALTLSVTARTTAATLPPPETSYNFLVLTPVGSISHRNVFMPLVNELIKRGHKVTILSGHPPPSDLSQNITYINHELPHVQVGNYDMFAEHSDPKTIFQALITGLTLVARDIYKVESVQQLYGRRHEFDLIMIDDSYNEVVYPFLFEKSFITVATGGLKPMQSAVIGNVLNPAYVPNPFIEYPTPMSFVDRVTNLFMTVSLPIHWKLLYVVPGIQKEISKQFPELPPLDEIEHNQSLTLLNSHFSISTPLPLVPAQIEVGGMHCRPGKPLPQDINDFVTGSEPVVYFSIGTVAQGRTIPSHYQQLLLSAFGKLPYKFIWKLEVEKNDLPKNVMVKKWMPQQDVLAHPNVKLFITHCGLLSSQEAMYHGVPVLGLPIFSDQPKNALRFQRKGLGKMLIWKELTEQLIIDTIEELITNPSYQSEASRILATFKDQPQSPVERAVFWTEYVIRHSGAVHLRSLERDLSWVEFLHLDILLALHLVLFLLVWSIKKMLKFCFVSASSKNIHKKKKRD